MVIWNVPRKILSRQDGSETVENNIVDVCVNCKRPDHDNGRAPEDVGKATVPAVTLLLMLNTVFYAYDHVKLWWHESARRNVTKQWAHLTASWRTGFPLGTPTHAQLELLRTGITRAAQAVVCAMVVVGTEAHLDSDRWWCVPSIVSALAITPSQVAAIDHVYQEGVPTQLHTSEDVSGLMNDVAKRVRDGAYDDDLLYATERLAETQAKQGELRRRASEHAARVITPLQLNKLNLRNATQSRGLPSLQAGVIDSWTLVLGLLLGLTLGTGLEALWSWRRKPQQDVNAARSASQVVRLHSMI